MMALLPARPCGGRGATFRVAVESLQRHEKAKAGWVDGLVAIELLLKGSREWGKVAYHLSWNVSVVSQCEVPSS